MERGRRRCDVGEIGAQRKGGWKDAGGYAGKEGECGCDVGGSEAQGR